MKSTRVYLLVVLALLGSGAASAQEETREPREAPTLPVTPPPLVPAPEDTDAPVLEPGPDTEVVATPEAPARGEIIPRRYKPSLGFVPRVSVEVLSGTAGGFVGGGLGFLTGYLIGAPTVGCEDFTCFTAGLVGGLAGAFLGIPAGTYFSGRLLRGQGSFLSTLGGSLVGWGGATLGALLANASGSGESETLGTALLLLPVMGATMGYELSHAYQMRAQQPRGARLMRVVPLVGLTPRGPRLGLAGHF